MLFFRYIKRAHYMSGRFRRYLGYAVGEVLLVIVGILIALRIDTWHEERQTRRTVDDYLQSIARNIEEDIREIDTLTARRGSILFASKLARWHLGWTSTYTVDEIKHSSDALTLAREHYQFSANTSGYEGLKNSGVLSHLDNQYVESLLFRYYDTVARINDLEETHNDYLTGLALEFTSYDFGHLLLLFREPEFLSEEEFQGPEMQSAYNDLLTNPIVMAWYEGADLQSLLLAYAQLKSLGDSYVEYIRSGRSRAVPRPADVALLDPGSNTGFPNVLQDGGLSWHTYTVDWSPNSSESQSENNGNFNQFINVVRFGEQRMDITYPGLDRLIGPNWGAIYIYSGRPAPSHMRRSGDFSAFSRLSIEMKGKQGGEQFSLHIKDRDDPDDGSQTNMPVTLTDEWQTYEFDLASFENADLEKLYVVAGFLFVDERGPVSFSVRNITYLR